MSTARMHRQREVLRENGRFNLARPITRGGGGPVSQAALAPPTGVTPGTPGSFTPPGCDIPGGLAGLRALGALGETTAWTVGQRVVLDDASVAHWDGNSWESGNAPA